MVKQHGPSLDTFLLQFFIFPFLLTSSNCPETPTH